MTSRILKCLSANRIYIVLFFMTIITVLLAVTSNFIDKIEYAFENRYYQFVSRNMESIETDHFIIKYQDESDGLLVAEISEKYYEEVSSIHDYHQDGKIPIIIHDKENMSHGTLLKANKVPMGLYSSGIIQVLSPKEWIDDEENIKDIFEKDGPIVHEMSHYMIDKSTDKVYKPWILEGIALYVEYKATGYTIAKEDQYNELYTLEELEKDFKKLDKIKAYYSSFIIIKKTIEEKDFEYMDNMLEYFYKQV